jgi:hypothetical protein
MKLSKNLSLNEAIKSNTAIKNGLDNKPTEEHLANLKVTAEKIFQPIREHFGMPIGVSSGYRSESLNSIIGGSKTSQHCKGEAFDLDADMFGGIDNKQIFDFIRDNLEFDQLISEFGTEDKPAWIHVSYTTARPNRNVILRADKVNGKTKYFNYNG